MATSLSFAVSPAHPPTRRAIRACSRRSRRIPGIHLVKSVFTGWEYAPAASDMLAILNSGTKVDGVWTSGIDYTVVNAFKTAGKPYVPIVGTDGNGFIHQLLTLKGQGLTGAVVTNPAVIGGVAAHIAIEKLTGGSPKKVDADRAAADHLRPAGRSCRSCTARVPRLTSPTSSRCRRTRRTPPRSCRPARGR